MNENELRVTAALRQMPCAREEHTGGEGNSLPQGGQWQGMAGQGRRSRTAGLLGGWSLREAEKSFQKRGLVFKMQNWIFSGIRTGVVVYCNCSSFTVRKVACISST